MRKVLMMRKSTNATPSERIQLSNHRANLDRRLGGGGGALSGDAATALGSTGGAPKSCMCRTLVRCPARRNSHRPYPGTPNPPTTRIRSRQSPHSRQAVDALGVEWRATSREDDHQRFVMHDPGRHDSPGVGIILRTCPEPKFTRAPGSGLRVDLRPLQP